MKDKEMVLIRHSRLKEMFADGSVTKVTRKQALIDFQTDKIVYFSSRKQPNGSAKKIYGSSNE